MSSSSARPSEPRARDDRRPALGLRWAVAVGKARGRQLAAAAGVRPRTRYVWQRIDEHRACWAAAASALQAELVTLAPGFWEVRRGAARTRIAVDRVQLDDPVTLEVAGDKALCYRLAAEAGVRAPEHAVFDRRELTAAWALVVADGHPFVVKPARGTSAGIGVTVGVRTRAELVDAFATAAIRDRRVIVERMVAGETCRLLFLDGELIHAVRRRGISVEGDGSSPLRSLLVRAGLQHLPADRLTLAALAAQDLSLDDVPAAGRRIVVRGAALHVRRADEVRTVYDETITGLVGGGLVEEAARVVRAVGSAWAGVDVVTPDPTRPLAVAGAFLEVNTTPGILHHCDPGPEPCAVAVRVLGRLLGVA